MNRSVLKAKQKIAFYFSRYFFFSRVYGQKKRIVASELIKNKSTTFFVFPFSFFPVCNHHPSNMGVADCALRNESLQGVRKRELLTGGKMIKRRRKRKKPTMKWLGSSTRVYQNGISDSWASQL
jgi:hypothetical protein